MNHAWYDLARDALVVVLAALIVAGFVFGFTIGRKK
jgi:hypothetical protein